MTLSALRSRIHTAPWFFKLIFIFLLAGAFLSLAGLSHMPHEHSHDGHDSEEGTEGHCFVCKISHSFFIFILFWFFTFLFFLPHQLPQVLVSEKKIISRFFKASSGRAPPAFA